MSKLFVIGLLNLVIFSSFHESEAVRDDVNNAPYVPPAMGRISPVPADRAPGHVRTLFRNIQGYMSIKKDLETLFNNCYNREQLRTNPAMDRGMSIYAALNTCVRQIAITLTDHVNRHGRHYLSYPQAGIAVRDFVETYSTSIQAIGAPFIRREVVPGISALDNLVNTLTRNSGAGSSGQAGPSGGAGSSGQAGPSGGAGSSGQAGPSGGAGPIRRTRPSGGAGRFNPFGR